LVIVKQIPALPFDGGRVVRPGLHLVSPQLAYWETVVIVGRVGRIVALILVITGFLLWRDTNPLNQYLPAWIIGLGLAWVVFFCSRQAEMRREKEDGEDYPFGYDFSEGYTSLERSSGVARGTATAQPNIIVRWYRRHQMMRHELRRQRDAQEDKLVDEILDQLHEHGYDALSHEQQRLLRRASVRYRRKPND
jgi:hypothetical protein